VLCDDVVGRTSCDGQSNFTGGRLYLFHTIWYYASTDEVRGKLLYLICNCPQWFAASSAKLLRTTCISLGALLHSAFLRATSLALQPLSDRAHLRRGVHSAGDLKSPSFVTAIRGCQLPHQCGPATATHYSFSHAKHRRHTHRSFSPPAGPSPPPPSSARTPCHTWDWAAATSRRHQRRSVRAASSPRGARRTWRKRSPCHQKQQRAGRFRQAVPSGTTASPCPHHRHRWH
jgi:hypothetical protein